MKIYINNTVSSGMTTMYQKRKGVEGIHATQFRCDIQTWKAIMKDADEEGRSINSWLVNTARDYLERKKRKGKFPME